MTSGAGNCRSRTRSGSGGSRDQGDLIAEAVKFAEELIRSTPTSIQDMTIDKGNDEDSARFRSIARKQAD